MTGFSKKILFFSLFFLLTSSNFAYAEEVFHFFVEPTYDREDRREVGAYLQRVTNKVNFYVDISWWNNLEEEERNHYDGVMYNLGNTFEMEIYPKMTSTFGDSLEHPVDRDDRISVLFHPMREQAGGYFNSADQYSKHQNPRSNEKKLLYLNTAILDSPILEGYLAHEFMHLITFNQKERKRGVREEIWLNEARAEYMPTFLGYDDDYEKSNLRNRVEIFLRDPDISLTEWINQRADYGVVNIFSQYLVDHYGIEILVDSLQSEKVGIESINYALEKNGYEEDFSDIFNQFKIAVLLNDCDLGEYYCFKNEDLHSLKVSPATNFLPSAREGSLAIRYRSKNWAGNWHEITGGEGTLSFIFELEEDVRVSLPYILCNYKEECQVEILEVDNKKKELTIEGFSTEYKSLIILPSIQDKMEGFNGAERSYAFTWRAELIKEEESKERVAYLLERIAQLRERIEYLERRIREERGECLIGAPLYYGMSGERVSCLQEFLATKPDIYPEGIVSGNFLSLTREAVIRFQEKYKEEILSPLGLSQGTGYLGESTLAKINQLR